MFEGVPGPMRRRWSTADEVSHLQRRHAKRLRRLLKDLKKEMQDRDRSKGRVHPLDATVVVCAVFSPRLNSYAAHQVANHYKVFEHDLGIFLLAPRYVANWFATSGVYHVSGSSDAPPPVQVLDDLISLDVIETAGVLWDITEINNPFSRFAQCVMSAKLLNL